MRRSILLGTLLIMLLASAAPAHAYVHEGQPAPDFTKHMVVGPPWTTGPNVSLHDYAGKVVVIFLLGWD